MRTLATILNSCLVLLLSFFLFQKGAPDESDEILLVSLAFAAPISSLIAIYLERGNRSDGLVSLYFERKRLEEQQRINQLRSPPKA